MRQALEDKMRNALFGSHQRASNNDVPPLGGNRPDVRPPQKHYPLDPTLYGRFSHHLLYKGSFWAAIPRSAATGRRSDVWERDYLHECPTVSAFTVYLCFSHLRESTTLSSQGKPTVLDDVLTNVSRPLSQNHTFCRTPHRARKSSVHGFSSCERCERRDVVITVLSGSVVSVYITQSPLHLISVSFQSRKGYDHNHEIR